MPTFVHGKNTVFKLDNATPTLTDISSYLSEIGFPRDADLLETTTFGATAKTYILGFKNATISLTGRWDATIDGHFSGILGQDATVSFEYFPAGEPVGATKPKYSGEARCTNYEQTGSVGDVVGFTAELQVDGAVTRAVA